MRTEEPLLLILEDLHWVDALTIKLLETTLRTLTDYPFMVLALSRPEVQALYPNLWAGVVQALSLHPLPKRAGERLVQQILGKVADGALVARLVEQSAGNPLFLEETVRLAS
jgi:predicted ATPase